jgi:hypothetical protein
MCAARVRLPAPAVAAALGGSVASPGCELVAAAMSDGRLALIASVEDDLWEETLEVRRRGTAVYLLVLC